MNLNSMEELILAEILEPEEDPAPLHMSILTRFNACKNSDCISSQKLQTSLRHAVTLPRAADIRSRWHVFLARLSS